MDNSKYKTEGEIMEDFESISSEKVHETLKKYMLVDGFDITLDLKNSSGIKIVDERNGEEYIDFFTFFASNPLGLNHPKINNEAVRSEFADVSVNKPSNSDIYTTCMAEFVDTFSRVAKPDYMKYLFFISGGALAVENALKVAFDWKVQKNFAKGIKEEKGQKIIHFREAFHGRSGYTMSLTNTEPNKVKYFPKFDWPRITNPKISFPLNSNLDEVKKLEALAIDEINNAIKNNPDDIAAIIIEPIQGEGGDNFFRKEFFQKLKEISDANEIMLIFDEVQTGFGLTGKFWAHQHYDVIPDIVAFGKKAQVCGIMVGEKVDEVEENVFKKSSRINSTWGGNLVDMIRSKHIMRIIEEDNLVENSAKMGNYLLGKLYEFQEEFTLVSKARGLGLMCSFDFPNSELRNKFRELCYENKLIILGCGQKSVRFRTPLNVSKSDLDEGLNVIRKVLNLISSNN